MADDQTPLGSGRPRFRVVATLAGIIVVAGAAGAVVALGQRSPPPPPTTSTASSVPAVTPSPVPAQPVLGFGASVADDPASHQVIAFGGVDSYDTTWLWGGGGWSLARPPVSPPGRFGAAAAYDPTSRWVLLFGGRLGPGEVVNDTWAWDGNDWLERDVGGAGAPPPGEGALMAWDDATQQMVLVTPGITAAGETWVWTGARWLRQLTGDLPLNAAGRGLAFDPASHRLLLVGARLPTGAVGSTWEWAGDRWHALPGATPIGQGGVALDPATGRLLLCGTVSGPVEELWTWIGERWMAVPNSELPRVTLALVPDIDHHRLLLLGVIAEPNQGSPEPLEVWYWNWRTHLWQQVIT